MKTNFTLFTTLNRLFSTVAYIFLFTSSTIAHGMVSVSPHLISRTISQENISINSGVIYASIDALHTEKAILVKWVTSFEKNNSHFEVERSVDMGNFKTIGLVLDGFSAEGTGKIYQFKDNSTVMNNSKFIYYRLKQIDNDGKESYSKILSVEAARSITAALPILPNLFTNQLSVRINATETGITNLNMPSLSGQLLLSKQATIIKCITNIQVEGFLSLPPGTYLTV